MEYDIQESDFQIVPLSIQPLVENAIRHGIYERGNEGGIVKISSYRQKDKINIMIEDNGVGFDVEKIAKEVKAHERDSTGLQNLIFRFENLMNATVNIESVIGTGTKVTIKIPVKGEKTMRAIIVDDEPIMLRSFMRLSSGIPNLNVIAQFGSGEEAISFVEKNAVELAILDIRMPVMNGIELAVNLREICPNLLIVFISAYDEYVRDSNMIGGDYYIVKPYKRETIEIMVQKMQILSQALHTQIKIQMFGRFKCS